MYCFSGDSLTIGKSLEKSLKLKKQICHTGLFFYKKAKPLTRPQKIHAVQ